MSHFKITHTEVWPYKKVEHDEITLPKEAMLAFLGNLTWEAFSVVSGFAKYTFHTYFTRADGDVDVMSHEVWVEEI